LFPLLISLQIITIVAATVELLIRLQRLLGSRLPSLIHPEKIHR
jgi:hypothetical protein